MQNKKAHAPNHKQALRSNVRPSTQTPDDEYLSAHVERALLTVRRYLAPEQAQLVRRLVRSSLETDPVSKQLFAKAASMTKPTPRERTAPDGHSVPRRSRRTR
jgi:hypothetical protein